MNTPPPGEKIKCLQNVHSFLKIGKKQLFLGFLKTFWKLFTKQTITLHGKWNFFSMLFVTLKTYYNDSHAQ